MAFLKKDVIHCSTNKAQRPVTSPTETNTLLLTQAATMLAFTSHITVAKCTAIPWYWEIPTIL